MAARGVVLLACLLSACAQDRTVPLTYWLEPEVSAEGLDVSDGPCGLTASITAPRIPPGDKRVGAETVIEVNAQGREVRRWAMPVYSQVAGLDGDRLLVTVAGHENLGLSIAPDGRYRTLDEAKALDPEAQGSSCPNAEFFEGSVYAVCTKVNIGGAVRFLLWEDPCT